MEKGGTKSFNRLFIGVFVPDKGLLLFLVGVLGVLLFLFGFLGFM